MPLTAKGSKILKAMEAQYGAKKGEEVFYASKNKGTISGVDSASKMDALGKIADACEKYDAGRDDPEKRKRGEEHETDEGFWISHKPSGQRMFIPKKSADKKDALGTIAAACDSYERTDDPIPTTPAIEKFIEKTNAEVGMHPNIK